MSRTADIKEPFYREDWVLTIRKRSAWQMKKMPLPGSILTILDVAFPRVGMDAASSPVLCVCMCERFCVCVRFLITQYYLYTCVMRTAKRDFLGTAGLKKVSKGLSHCWQFEPGLVLSGSSRWVYGRQVKFAPTTVGLTILQTQCPSLLERLRNGNCNLGLHQWNIWWWRRNLIVFWLICEINDKLFWLLSIKKWEIFYQWLQSPNTGNTQQRTSSWHPLMVLGFELHSLIRAH